MYTSGKLTVLPQSFQIRVSFFLYWTCRMWRRVASIPPLPGLTTLAALMLPGATPCPPSGKLWKGSTGSARHQFQNRVAFCLYGCWTSGMSMRMAPILHLPGLTTLATPMPPGATPCPLSGKLWKGGIGSGTGTVSKLLHLWCNWKTFLYGNEKPENLNIRIYTYITEF